MIRRGDPFPRCFASGSIRSVKWAFRNKIVLNDKLLEASLEDYMLSEEGDERVGLNVDHRNERDNAAVLLLEGGGYASPDAALAAGNRWRRILSVSFANVGIAADFDAPPYPSRYRNDLPIDPEIPGLLVWEVVPGYHMEWAEAETSRPMNVFVSDDLPLVESLSGGLSSRIFLAYELAHLALSNRDNIIKFILWVSAIEALIPDEPQIENQEMLTYLGDLIEEVKASGRFDSKIRRKVVNVDKGKVIPITELGADLAKNLSAEYDSKSAEEFFRENYPLRSALVHGSNDPAKRPSRDEIKRRVPILQEFVLDLLRKEAGLSA